MKRVCYNYALLCIVVLVAMMVAAEARTCDPTELSPCIPALTTPVLPTMQCCVRLRDQIPCLCGYRQNPAYRGYMDSANARKISAYCAVSLPSCPP